GLAARERGHRLAELQVLEADVGERREARAHLGGVGEEGPRLRHREIQHVRDAAAAAVGTLAPDLQDLVAIAAAVALRAAQVHVGEKLHLDVLEAAAVAGRAAAVAGDEAEGSGTVLAPLRRRPGGQPYPDSTEGPDTA